MAIAYAIAGLMWFAAFVGYAFFDYEPSRFVIGVAIFWLAFDMLKDAADEMSE